MQPSKKAQSGDRPTARGAVDSGTSAGLLAALLVLGAWGLSLVEWRGRGGARPEPAPSRPASSRPAPRATAQESSGHEEGFWFQAFEGDEGVAATAAPAGGAPAIPVEAWKRDVRWSRAVEGGDGASDLVEETLRWQKAVGGDPQRYRHQMDQSAVVLEKALADLRSLREDYREDPGALEMIQHQIEFYLKSLAKTRK